VFEPRTVRFSLAPMGPLRSWWGWRDLPAREGSIEDSCAPVKCAGAVENRPLVPPGALERRSDVRRLRDGAAHVAVASDTVDGSSLAEIHARRRAVQTLNRCVAKRSGIGLRSVVRTRDLQDVRRCRSRDHEARRDGEDNDETLHCIPPPYSIAPEGTGRVAPLWAR
jgi:hypothetical protein